MEDRNLPFRYLPVSHIGVQEMDRNNPINAKNTYSYRLCLTRLRSGKCNAVLLLVAALIVWLFIHVINAKDSTEHSVKIEHLHEIEERETNQTNEDLMETRGLEDVEHFSVESTTHTDGGGTTQALYDQNNEEIAGSGSGNIGSTESPSDIAKDDGSVTYGIDEDMRQNPDGHTEEPIHDDYLARIDHDMHKQTDDKSEVTGEGTGAPTNDSRLVESLKDVLNTANDLNKNAKGDDSQSDIMAVGKELAVSEVREEETQDDNILRQYDYINSVQKNLFSDSDNKRTLMVQPVAKPGVEFTGDIQEKDTYTNANTDQNSDKTLDKEGSDVKVDIHQGYSNEDSVYFKSRDVMSAKLGEETKHKNEITSTDRNVIRKRRSLVHIIKAPLESRVE